MLACMSTECARGGLLDLLRLLFRASTAVVKKTYVDNKHGAPGIILCENRAIVVALPRAEYVL